MEGAWILLLLPQLQPYESSAPDGMVIVGILERAIDRQALVRHQNDDCLQKQYRRDFTVGTALRADRLCGSVSECKSQKPFFLRWKKQEDGREDRFEWRAQKTARCHAAAGRVDPHLLYARARIINMDLVLLFHCRRAIPLVLMFVLLSSLPALCSAETVPVHFHNTGSSLLGSRLLVLGFMWRRYAYFVQARVLSYVLHAAILANLAPILSRPRGKLPFLEVFAIIVASTIASIPAAPGSRDRLMIMFCPDD